MMILKAITSTKMVEVEGHTTKRGTYVAPFRQRHKVAADLFGGDETNKPKPKHSLSLFDEKPEPAPKPVAKPEPEPEPKFVPAAPRSAAELKVLRSWEMTYPEFIARNTSGYALRAGDSGADVGKLLERDYLSALRNAMTGAEGNKVGRYQPTEDQLYWLERQLGKSKADLLAPTNAGELTAAAVVERGKKIVSDLFPAFHDEMKRIDDFEKSRTAEVFKRVSSIANEWQEYYERTAKAALTTISKEALKNPSRFYPDKLKELGTVGGWVGIEDFCHVDADKLLSLGLYKDPVTKMEFQTNDILKMVGDTLVYADGPEYEAFLSFQKTLQSRALDFKLKVRKAGKSDDLAEVGIKCLYRRQELMETLRSRMTDDTKKYLDGILGPNAFDRCKKQWLASIRIEELPKDDRRYKKINSGDRKAIKDGLTSFFGLCGRAARISAVTLINENRSYANLNKDASDPTIAGEENALSIGESGSRMLTSLFHEAGHVLEMSDKDLVPPISRKFIEERTPDGKADKLNNLYPGKKGLFRNDEVARSDGGVSPYVWKLYGGRVTEVISMGAERFATPETMEGFHRIDPQHFYMVVAIMHREGSELNSVSPDERTIPASKINWPDVMTEYRVATI